MAVKNVLDELENNIKIDLNDLFKCVDELRIETERTIECFTVAKEAEDKKEQFKSQLQKHLSFLSRIENSIGGQLNILKQNLNEDIEIDNLVNSKIIDILINTNISSIEGSKITHFSIPYGVSMRIQPTLILIMCRIAEIIIDELYCYRRLTAGFIKIYDIKVKLAKRVKQNLSFLNELYKEIFKELPIQD